MHVLDDASGDWSVVTDVHGAPGTSGWRQLVPGRPLDAPWEAVELARLGRDGVSGAHRHSRTNEIYLVLSGEAELELNGRRMAMAPGWLSVVTAGQTHGLRNAGEKDLYWLVIEAPAFGRRSGVRGGAMPPEFPAVDLFAAKRVDLAALGAGPLAEAVVEDLEPGRSVALRARDGEIFGYLLEGSGVVVGKGAEHPVGPRTGIVLTMGEEAEFRATTAARLFWARAEAAAREESS